MQVDKAGSLEDATRWINIRINETPQQARSERHGPLQPPLNNKLDDTSSVPRDGHDRLPRPPGGKGLCHKIADPVVGSL